MCALIAWSSYWRHLETCSSLATSFSLPNKGNRKENYLSLPVGYSHSPVSSHVVKPSSAWVWGWCIFNLFSRALVCETALYVFPPLLCCCGEKVVPDFGQPPTFVCFEPGFHCLYLMATASQDWSCWCCIFNGVRRLIHFAAHLTPFQVGQSQIKQLCSFLWALSLLFIQPFLIFNLDF